MGLTKDSADLLAKLAKEAVETGTASPNHLNTAHAAMTTVGALLAANQEVLDRKLDDVLQRLELTNNRIDRLVDAMTGGVK